VLLDGCTGCELCAKICPDFCFEVYRGEATTAGAATPGPCAGADAGALT
jgi:formate hydrogenlyase subunit 6/NADH:ubiquinone oxidoreductase subunit I